MSSFDFDSIVIGSGFGGSVMTYRLAQKGYKVCLLERGKEYPMQSFPRRIHEVKERMFWDPEDKKFGFMEVRDNPDSDLMSVTSSGLGGGSLIYANVLIPMPKEYFEWWPKPYTRELLDPHYKNVIDMMEASPYPFGKEEYYSNTPKTGYMEQAANSMPKSEYVHEGPEFILPDLAVRFEGDFPGHQTKNKHGAIQSKCNKCGECDVGCNIHAKNTLDLNYLFAARNLKENPAEIRTSAQVEQIIPIEGGGYQVEYCDPENPAKKKKISAKKVFISAGSLGSTEILLKQKRNGNLKNLSPALGTKWCGNGDLLGFGMDTKVNADPTNGPVITSAIKYKFAPYLDGYPSALYLEDAGAPVGLAWFFAAKIPHPKNFFQTLGLGWRFLRNFIEHKFGFLNPRQEVNIGDRLADSLDSDKGIRKLLVLLGMGKDRSDGKLELRDDGELLIKWEMEKSKLHFDRTREQMRNVTEQLGGHFMDNPLTDFEKIIAVHPLGGCPMGEDKNEGVVNTKGEVFGHEGLFVVDGSILPTSVGPNPSLTIAAVAEHIAEQF